MSCATLPISDDSGQVVHTRVSVIKQSNMTTDKGQWCSAVRQVTLDLAQIKGIYYKQGHNEGLPNYITGHTNRMSDFNLV